MEFPKLGEHCHKKECSRLGKLELQMLLKCLWKFSLFVTDYTISISQKQNIESATYFQHFIEHWIVVV